MLKFFYGTVPQGMLLAIVAAKTWRIAVGYTVRVPSNRGLSGMWASVYGAFVPWMGTYTLLA